MVLPLLTGTVVALTGAVIYLTLERRETKEALRVEQLKLKATISYVEDLAAKNQELTMLVASKTSELNTHNETKSQNQPTVKSGRPRKK